MSEDIDRIAEFYSGRKIFVVGATGFVGKVFLEKVLRSFPDIGTIYMLIRPKNGKDPKERLLDTLSDVLFDQVKELRGIDHILEKIKIIPGDSTILNLGLSEEDQDELVNNVSVIYNFAATIRFNEVLSKAVILNTRGVRELLSLAKKCKHLELFLHMSTAYCHLNVKFLLDKAYDPPRNPHDIIKLVETIGDKGDAELTKLILGYHPNTYSFTKALAEGLVNEASKEIPTLIVRPSNIIPILYEPIPGWTDNLNGPTGLLLAGGRGALRIMHADLNSYADFVPVDLLVNGLFISTFNYVFLKDHNRKVTNYVSSAEIKVTYLDVVEIGKKAVVTKYPFSWSLWYPGATFTTNKLWYDIQAFFFHWIPAYTLDFIMIIAGYEPIMKRVHRRIAAGIDVIRYYTNNKWDFCNDGVIHLRTILNSLEKKNYCIHSEGFEINRYFEDCSLSARRYLMKDSDDTLPRDRKIMKRLYYVDRITKIVFKMLVVYWSLKFLMYLYGKFV